MKLIDRVKNILLTPKTEWEVINSEPAEMNKILTGYIIPLACAAALAALVGWGFIGMGMGQFGRAVGINFGFLYAITYLISTIGGVYITAYVMNFLAPSFGTEKNLPKIFQLVVYSYTAVWVANLLVIIPALSIIAGLISLYGLYLLYLGMEPLLKTPKDKVAIYLVVSIIVLIIVYGVLYMIVQAVMKSIFGMPYRI